jgi:hypothetical protein
MSYPESMETFLVSVDGNSCGTLKHLVELNSNVNPPEYREVSGGGDFDYVRCWRIDDGSGGQTWRMDIWYNGGTLSCTGYHACRRNADGDDPTGDYCYYDGSSTDCSKVEASNVEA